MKAAACRAASSLSLPASAEQSDLGCALPQLLPLLHQPVAHPYAVQLYEEVLPGEVGHPGRHQEQEDGGLQQHPVPARPLHSQSPEQKIAGITFGSVHPPQDYNPPPNTTDTEYDVTSIRASLLASPPGGGCQSVRSAVNTVPGCGTVTIYRSAPGQGLVNIVPGRPILSCAAFSLSACSIAAAATTELCCGRCAATRREGVKVHCSLSPPGYVMLDSHSCGGNNIHTNLSVKIYIC